jgi:hypothetical protein
VLACSKETLDKTKTSDQNSAAVTSELQSVNAVVSTCDQFAYPDTIFYLTNLPGSYVVNPVTPLTGTYGANPAGLKINASSGSIDITGSETGLEYAVWFLAKGAKDTCKKFITVSGINYMDSTYVLANNPDTAGPIYNANPLKPTDCSGGCQFDVGPVAQQVSTQGIAINKATGVINLKKSFQNGALGKNPVNGTFKDFILQYRLGDKSGGALNQIGFRLYYYKMKSQIPASLIETETAKQGQVLIEGQESETGDDHGGSGKGSLASLMASKNASPSAKQGTVKCRPPYIIITQQ